MKKQNGNRSRILPLLLALLLLSGCQTGENGTETTAAPSQTEPPFSAETSSPDTSVPADLPEGFTVAKHIDQYVIKEKGFVYVNVLSPYFEIGGIEHPESNGNEYFRLDAAKKDTYSAQTVLAASHTAGVTVRFRVKAAQISLRIAQQNTVTEWPTSTDIGAYGVDVYAKVDDGESFLCETNGIRQFLVDANGFTERVLLPGGIAEVTLYLPIFSGVTKLEIGLPLNGWIAPPEDRSYGDIAFVGGTATQGMGTSRPSLSYPAQTCRLMNADCVNLGFFGTSWEKSAADCLASRDLGAVVMEWGEGDAVTVRSNHYATYQAIRKACPSAPILLLAPPAYGTADRAETAAKDAVVRDTYRLAQGAGDTRVFLLSGDTLVTAESSDLCTVDGVHPNELGHFFMARAIAETLRPILDGE